MEKYFHLSVFEVSIRRVEKLVFSFLIEKIQLKVNKLEN